MKKTKKNTTTHHEYIHWNVQEIITVGIIAILIIFLVSSGKGIINSKYQDPKTIYYQCTETCQKSNYGKWQIQPETEGKYVGRTEGASIELIERRSTLQEFDRTQCVKNCNDLYIQITKK